MTDNHEQCEVETSSGNVFADLGLPDADEMLIKADILVSILRVIKARKLTQKKAAEIMGIDQPGVSNLMRGRIRGYSMDRLMRFLTALDQDVQIVIKPADHSDRAGARGKITVVAPG